LEINTYLLNRILGDQKKAWELLERWTQAVEGDIYWAELLKETETYLDPIRKGLLEIQDKMAESQEVKVIKNPKPISIKVGETTGVDIGPFISKEEEARIMGWKIKEPWDYTLPCRFCNQPFDKHEESGTIKNLCPGIWMPGCRPFYEPKGIKE